MDIAVFESLPNSLKEKIVETMNDNEELDYDVITHKISELLQIPFLDLKLSNVDLDQISEYGIDTCIENRFLPLYKNGVIRICALSRPWMKTYINKIVEKDYDEVRMVVVNEEVLLGFLEQIRLSGKGRRVFVEEKKGDPKIIFGWGRGDDLDLAKELIRNAYKMGASDVHIEPMEDRVAIKYRINGVLVLQTPVEAEHKWSVIDAFKKLAGVPVADRQSLKDGSFSVDITENKRLDIRFVALPVGGKDGEKLVMRLLDKDVLKKMMGGLPFEGDRLTLFENCLQRDNGLILITGPTGSGKSTTLYTALLSLDLAANHVITVEDPIEYRIEKIIQMQVDRANGLTTANALRAILRGDPDVILVGEIRDNETAELAVSASNTGHLVLSTLHTNDAISVITRMLDLGLSKQEVYENLTLAVAQRLIPTICPNCKIEYNIKEHQKLHFGHYNLEYPDRLATSVGCAICKGTGIGGRKPVFQFMYMNQEMKDLIATDADLSELRIANRKNFMPLIGDALTYVKNKIADYDRIRGIEDEYIIRDEKY